MERAPLESAVSLPRQPSLQEGTPAQSAVLTAQVACQIEQALQRVGDFGEVRLVVVKGRLRFIQVMRSENVQEP